MILSIRSYYLFLLLPLLGCVDNLPVTLVDAAPKYFIVCEMIPDQNIEAVVSLTGNTSGILPSELTSPEELVLSISEDNRDLSVNFKYNKDTKKFVVSSQDLNPKIGETYRIREGNGAFFSINEDIKLQVPNPIVIDSIEVLTKSITVLSDNTVRTALRCKIKLNNAVNSSSYLYVVPKTTTDIAWKIDKVASPFGAYNIQNHQAGCVIDYDLTGNGILMDISFDADLPQEKIKFTIFNTTRTYFYYNNFLSNIYGQIDQSLSANPAIAAEGLNIRTDKAIGSFSALVPTSIVVSF